ncbi:MAG: S-layer homology domain-containing protein [Synergistota bacterium]|nr:S-layer homology domain-containing protein [Synergistota bacterium]
MKKRYSAIFAASLCALMVFGGTAFAANPFMDVPAGHWAYDAVAQLAARGVVSGYQDGTYSGAQHATRYEMASVVARSLAKVDIEKASKQDLEMLKKLVMEFKDELDALGVKSEKIDRRVAVLEDGVGGWNIRGTFRFDAKFANSDNSLYLYNRSGDKIEFNKERFRLYLTKQIDDKTSFFAEMRTGSDNSNDTGRGDLNGARWARMFLDTELPYSVAFRVGRFGVDFEDEKGLYIDNTALFGDLRADGFRFGKKFGSLDTTLVAGRNFNKDSIANADWTRFAESHMLYALDLNWQPSEKFFAGLTGYWLVEDNFAAGDWNSNTYAGYMSYSFTPAISVKGIYYMQDLGTDLAAGFENKPKAWKVVLDVKQEVLKFTDLWVEYSQQDNNFWGANNDRYSIGGSGYDDIGFNLRKDNGTSKLFFARAGQQWNDKWSTFLRYANFKSDTIGIDNADEWGVGVKLQYSPAVAFELVYDQVDHGQGAFNHVNGKESVVRFRTNVSF